MVPGNAGSNPARSHIDACLCPRCDPSGEKLDRELRRADALSDRVERKDRFG